MHGRNPIVTYCCRTAKDEFDLVAPTRPDARMQQLARRREEDLFQIQDKKIPQIQDDVTPSLPHVGACRMDHQSPLDRHNRVEFPRPRFPSMPGFHRDVSPRFRFRHRFHRFRSPGLNPYFDSPSFGGHSVPRFSPRFPFIPRLPNHAMRPSIRLPPALGIPPVRGAPAPHINPAFFPPGSFPPESFRLQPVKMTMETTEESPNRNSSSSPMSESDKADRIQRCHLVASKATAQAVKHASCFEYADAIKTLVVAINLIKWSNVQKEEPVASLLTNLEDTLSGVETRSYGDADKRASGHESGASAGDSGVVGSGSKYVGSERKAAESGSKAAGSLSKSAESRSKSAGSGSKGGTDGRKQSWKEEKPSRSERNTTDESKIKSRCKSREEKNEKERYSKGEKVNGKSEKEERSEKSKDDRKKRNMQEEEDVAKKSSKRYKVARERGDEDGRVMRRIRP